MEKTYLNESHRRYSEACQEEVKRMTEHPLTAEEKQAQMTRNARASRGGARPGAGRKALPEGDVRRTVSFRVAPETLAALETLRGQGVNVGRLFDDFVRNYCGRKKK